MRGKQCDKCGVEMNFRLREGDRTKWACPGCGNIEWEEKKYNLPLIIVSAKSETSGISGGA